MDYIHITASECTSLTLDTILLCSYSACLNRDCRMVPLYLEQFYYCTKTIQLSTSSYLKNKKAHKMLNGFATGIEWKWVNGNRIAMLSIHKARQATPMVCWSLSFHSVLLSQHTQGHSAVVTYAVLHINFYESDTAIRCFNLNPE